MADSSRYSALCIPNKRYTLELYLCTDSKVNSKSIYMQDSTKRARGRPRAYNRAAALKAITSLFWRHGFSATSLDDISAATSMSRPSLYQAFGSKADMYQQAFAGFVQRMATATSAALDVSESPDVALVNFFHAIMDIYFDEDSAVGCFVFCTTVAETGNHPEFQNALHAVIEKLDAALSEYFQNAQHANLIRAESDVQALATLTQGLLQHIAIRARAGDSKEELLKRVKSGLSAILDHHCSNSLGNCE
ncbi:TetR/AcrR family transcriptional regulator [Marinobacterium lacunae]|nr:TetR/AcrR family transcriptional regulator [Marinobacterium lacunae]